MNEIKTMGGERMGRYISRIHQQIDYLTAHPEEDQKRDEAWRKICDIENDSKATAKYTAMVPRKYWGMPMNETSLIDHLPAHINAYEYKSVITQCLKAVNDSMDHKHRNIMLIGASGIGKTYYACWQINALMHMIWYFDNPFHEKNAGNNFPHYWSLLSSFRSFLSSGYENTQYVYLSIQKQIPDFLLKTLLHPVALNQNSEKAFWATM